VSSNPPTTELGYEFHIPGATQYKTDMPGSGSWDVDYVEQVPELKWPNSVYVYGRMRNDPQIEALMRGMTMPIRRFIWRIDPSGARATPTQQVADDLGLQVVGQKAKAKRTKNSFNFFDHLREAMLAMLYGHMYFEQVGVIETDANGKKLWRLRHLEPRLPQSINEIRVERDGSLSWIRQLDEWNQPPIPIDRLVCYVYEKEGANWFGRSLLRAAYQPWILKDRLLRVDAIRHERNGMGVPIIELPERATDAQRLEAQKLANQYKIGMASGGALPFGMKLHLLGVEGTVSNVLDSIRYHDEAMARLMLQMFAQMGTQNVGSRALGETFVKFLARAQDTVAAWFRDVFNKYMITDWVDWNYGEDEVIPQLVFERDEDPELSAHELSQMVAQGVLTVDTDLENYLRDSYGLPPLAGDRPPPPAPQPALPPGGGTPPGQPDPSQQGLPPPPGNTNDNVTSTASRSQRQPRELTAASTLPGWRRQLSAQELSSGADFSAMQTHWEVERDHLVSMWRGIRDRQAAEIVDTVKGAADVESLTQLMPELSGVPDLAKALNEMARFGATQAASEAFAQGTMIATPELPDLTTVADAVATVMARSLGDTAARVAVRAGPGERGADAVEAHLARLSDAYLEDTLGGALTTAMNAGRFAVFASGPKPDEIIASEIMDGNTCQPCRQIDGTVFPDINAALETYPTGGFIDCLGQARCRGTIVTLYG
jgi:hypothetical protein